MNNKTNQTTTSGAAAAPVPRPLWRTYLAILVPMILTNMLQISAGTLDGIYLGQMIGVDSVAAVSAFIPVFFLLLAITIGLSTGATVLIGQAFGARDAEKGRAVAGTAIALVLGVSVAVALLGAAFAPQILSALGTPANVLADASLNARIMFAGAPVIFMVWLASFMSRGVGDAVSPLKALAVATLIAMTLTPALIKGWTGLPPMGTESAAISTLIAHAIALAWLARHWLRKGHALAPNAALLRHVRWNGEIARKMLRIGIPASLQMMTMASAELVLLGLINSHGSDATAAYGAVTQVMGWVQLPAMSIGITATILASHAIGAGKLERLPAVIRTGQQVNVLVTGAIVALAYLVSPWVMRLFLKDEQVLLLAQQLMRTVTWSIVIMGAVNVLAGVMRASGTVMVPALIGMLCIVGVELPIAILLHKRMGLVGIWWAYPAAYLAMLVLQSTFMKLVWSRKTITRLV